MAQVNALLTTGLTGLDRMLKGLIPGDNIVWQVYSIDDYVPFVAPYCRAALERGERLVYFRFAKHPPLVAAGPGVSTYELHPEAGFEAFIAQIHSIIERTGQGGYYVFDCLSDLAVEWYSDQMLGNFFLLTCPCLYDMEAIAYFSLLRNFHSAHAVTPISETAQVLIDVYRHGGRLYVHPTKVQQRYSPTMNMLHVWDGDDFTPVTESGTTAEILTSVPRLQLDAASYRLGVWNRTFFEAEESFEEARRGDIPIAKADEFFPRLLRMAVSRDERVLRLAEKHFTLADVLEVRRRMIGTGLIGGKSVGMLLARAILREQGDRWRSLLEAHDSFYIGSNVFYTFVVNNGIWWVRQKQRDPSGFLDGAERARHRMVTGTFPDYIMRQFESMLDYFGQSPIIVRSSSLLEDNFGNAFAGKYESVFCANQGPRHKRLEDFLTAVKTIYAGTMSEKALTYRSQRGLLDKDEQMALLVQRVSGGSYGSLYYPQIAGVGFSFNPYVWSHYIDPEAGMLRLVFGLGTRAVDRSDDDYTRVVALNAPDRRCESNFDEVRQYAQRRVDVLDLEANQLVSSYFSDVVARSRRLPIEMFADVDEDLQRRTAEAGRRDVPPYVLTFNRLFRQTNFVGDMRDMLEVLEKAYDYPVDVEFTANFAPDGGYRINLVQCRPFQVRGGGTVIELPTDIPRQNMLLEANGAVIGQSRMLDIDRFLYVVPSVYGQLPIAERYAVARLIGRVMQAGRGGKARNIMLLGPGRWGTTTPSLGVPVKFGDINGVSVLCEIVAMRDDLVPDVSLGTHFFNELVELDMLYLALFPTREDNFLNRTFFESAPSRLTDLVPDAERWANVVRVIDLADSPGRCARLHADTLSQKVVCYLK